VDEIVEVERVDLARIELLEAVADTLEQQAHSVLVILADHHPGCPAPGFVVLDVAKPNRFSHGARPTGAEARFKAATRTLWSSVLEVPQTTSNPGTVTADREPGRPA